MDMSGFEIYVPIRGVPYISITDNGITFSAQVTVLLRFPKYVQILINRSAKQIALRTCENSDKGAIEFYKEKRQKSLDIYSVRLNSQNIKDTLLSLIGDYKIGYGFRVKGRLVESGIFLFDMNDAKRIEGK